VTGYPESRLRFLALSAINLATERLYLPLQRRELLSEGPACLKLFLDQPVLRIYHFWLEAAVVCAVSARIATC
jgi:hypothetical protein